MYGCFVRRTRVNPGTSWFCGVCQNMSQGAVSSCGIFLCATCGQPRPIYFRCEPIGKPIHIHRFEPVCDMAATAECFELLKPDCERVFYPPLCRLEYFPWFQEGKSCGIPDETPREPEGDLVFALSLAAGQNSRIFDPPEEDEKGLQRGDARARLFIGNEELPNWSRAPLPTISSSRPKFGSHKLGHTSRQPNRGTSDAPLSQAPFLETVASTTKDDYKLALALSRSISDAPKDRRVVDTKLASKKQNFREFFYHETVVLPPLPYRCSCGWLNSRTKTAWRTGWETRRYVCSRLNCEKERTGYWTCERCTLENVVKPYDVKFNQISTEIPPAHECSVCEYRTRTITIVYKGGENVDLLTEAFLIAECRANLSFVVAVQPQRSIQSDANDDKELRNKQIALLFGMLRDGRPDEIDFDTLVLTSKEIVTILKKFSRHKWVDEKILWLLLHRKIPAIEIDDTGAIFSYWKELSLVLKENPFLILLCWWLTHPCRQWFPPETLHVLLMYTCAFSTEREKCLRKFVVTLCKVSYEEREKVAQVGQLACSHS